MAWNDVYGHDDAKRLLRVHLASREVPGAYLFVGPEGVGKRKLALEMARALNCTAEEGQRPCDQCPTCAQIMKGGHPDVHLLLPGGASDQVKIESVRQLLGRFALRPFNAAVQVALIDGAHRLTEEAANALLKALEEPSRSARFLLTTSRLADCLPTIVSRCQLVRCGPLPADVVRHLLTDLHGCDPRTAEAASRLSAGSVSRALELAGRWDAYQRTLARLGAEQLQTEWLERGLPETRQEVAQLLEEMTAWLRDVAVAAAGSPEQIAHTEHGEALRTQAAAMDVDRCVDTAFELLSLRESLEQFVSPRLVASLAREKWLSLLGA
ncbi:MAG: hypothetical protein A3B78_01390 [Omnitrophica WOR_2 bacterium RIFCSPHIGHO2_02_FULL_67_20]|nr:MAG: hypothetical protein A3B78_01390 [Omnitrophica WOR_2 bacterium RIFCSPHIGHO2_02_FULL_67_20]